MTDATARQYIAIDLKSFYASVECVDRGLDPLTTHLVVADSRRYLVVSSSLKSDGSLFRNRMTRHNYKFALTGSGTILLYCQFI